jgi:Rad3-related DNA helicase
MKRERDDEEAGEKDTTAARPSEAQIRETFEELFFRTARPQQVEFIETLHTALADKTSLCAELPTGTGKTLLSFYAAFAAKDYGYPSTLIVAGHQKRLQAQYAEEAARLARSGGDGSSCFVLYGRNNYICDARLGCILDADDPFGFVPGEETRKAVVAHFAAAFEAAQNAIEAPQDLTWTRSALQDWDEAAGALSLCTEVRDQVWEAVSARACTCDQKARKRQEAVGGELLLSCPRHVSRRHAKKAPIVVANMSYMSTLGAKGLLDSVLKDHEGRKRFVIYDEAHALLEAAQEIYEAQAASPLLLSDLAWASDAFSAQGWMKRCGLRGVRAALDALRPRDECLLFEAGAVRSGASRAEKEQARRLQAVRHAVLAGTEEDASSICDMCVRAHEATMRAEELVEPFKSAEKLAAFSGLPGCTAGELEASLAFPLHVVREPDVRTGGPNAKYGIALATLTARVMEHELAALRMTPEQTDAWRGVVRAAASAGGADELPGIISRLKRVMLGFRNARRACHASWVEGETGEQAPALAPSGVQFVLSREQKAEALKTVLCFDTQPPVMMSATLSSRGPRPFAMFETAVGHTFASSLVVQSPFPSASRVFWRPGGGMVRPTKFQVFGEEQRWLVQQADLIASTVSLNPRRLTLVISMSKEENRNLCDRLRTRLPGVEHVFFEEQRKFEELRADSSKKGVVYGCESLATGLDLPGLIGLVVVLKPLTLSCSADENYARDHLKRTQSMWNFYYWKSEYRFRQAVGRLVRAPDDAGVVLFFDLMNYNQTGPRGKEVAAVKTYFGRPVETTSNPLPLWPLE